MKRSLPRFSRTLALAAPAVALTTTRADADIFMKADNLLGESRTTTHKDWIEVLSMSYGVKNSATLGSGGTGGTGGIYPGKSEGGELTITKLLDSSSPALFLKCAKGEPILELKLEFEQLSSTMPVVYYRITLSNVLVTKMEPDANEDQRPSETVSFAYERIKVEYYKTDSKGGVPSTPTTVNWDFANNK